MTTETTNSDLDMTTSKEKEPRKPLKLSRPGTLELKKTVESGQVRQSFSHGRSKAVTVEVKRSRTFAPGAGGRMTEVTAAREAAEKLLGTPKPPIEPEVLTPEARKLTAGPSTRRAGPIRRSNHGSTPLRWNRGAGPASFRARER